MFRSRHFSRIQAIAPFTGEGFFVFGSKLLLWRLQCQVHSWTQYDDDFENVLHKDNDDDGDDDDEEEDDGIAGGDRGLLMIIGSGKSFDLQI